MGHGEVARRPLDDLSAILLGAVPEQIALTFFTNLSLLDQVYVHLAHFVLHRFAKGTFLPLQGSLSQELVWIGGTSYVAFALGAGVNGTAAVTAANFLAANYLGRNYHRVAQSATGDNRLRSPKK